MTVCYNAAGTMEETMLSVLNQTYPNVEYIVIDGGSTDGTVDIIKKYADRLAYWISEPDKGIYDAMNKGIAAATGDYINFMNAGDSFFETTVLTHIFSKNDFSPADVIFGDVAIKYDWGITIKHGRYFSGKEIRLPFSHQSVFVKLRTIPEGFDLSYHYAADHNMLYSLYKKGCLFDYYPITVALYDTNGISNYNIKSFKEVARINQYNKFEYHIRYIGKILKIIIVKIIPTPIINLYRKFKRLF